MADGQVTKCTGTVIVCPGCGYRGHGFFYIELIPALTLIERGVVRLDRAELRYDEIDVKQDRIECPECRRRFEITVPLQLTDRT